jgi:hypothetical protein
MPKTHIALIGLLGCTSVVGVVLAVKESHQAKELQASQDQFRSALVQANSQIQALTAQMASLNEAANEAAQQNANAPQAVAPVRVGPRRHSAVRNSTVRREDPRFQRIESQLAEQRQQIAQTQQDLQRTGNDLQGRLNSTRDELNGSIAKNHDELMAMEKRGERNYYEFQLTKSKEFQRVGPLSLSLRKANTKHQYYDLAMIVDDATLQKKHVNLFEPVWINLADRPQPVELVVNKVSKNEISGYVSEPKYKNSELAVAPAQTAGAGQQTAAGQQTPAVQQAGLKQR